MLHSDHSAAKIGLRNLRRQSTLQRRPSGSSSEDRESRRATVRLHSSAQFQRQQPTVQWRTCHESTKDGLQLCLNALVGVILYVEKADLVGMRPALLSLQILQSKHFLATLSLSIVSPSTPYILCMCAHIPMPHTYAQYIE